MTENASAKGLCRESFDSVQNRHYRQCAKEAKLAATVFLVALSYCPAVIVNKGYLPPPERPLEPDLVWGIPGWVFWGLLLPWCLMIGITCWFALFFLKDDEPLLPFPGETDPHGMESIRE